MLIVFDPTFDGLLSAVAWCFRSDTSPAALVPAGSALQLGEQIAVPTEHRIHQLFERHLTSLAGQAAESILDLAYHAYLSERDGIATWIFQYLKLAIRLKRNPEARLFEPSVKAVVDAARRTAGQAHIYLGLIRFKPSGEHFLVADFEPDCHVLPLILPHFADRMPDQAFAIRDLSRKVVAVHLPNGKTGFFELADEAWDGQPTALEPTEQDDDLISSAWQRYLEHLTIPERVNPKLMQANMPKKYWKYLTEDPGRLQKGETARQFPLE